MTQIECSGKQQGGGDMKKIMMLWMIACLAGCSYFVSIDELARNIQEQIQQEFNANPDYQHYRLTVLNVKIVHRQGNEFEAVSQLNYQGHEYPVNVKIIKVNGGYSWSIEDDAFAFIDEIEIEKYRQQLDRELEQITLSLDQDDLSTKVSVQQENFATGAMVQGSVAQQEQTMPKPNHDEKPYPVGNINAYTQ